MFDVDIYASKQEFDDAREWSWAQLGVAFNSGLIVLKTCYTCPYLGGRCLRQWVT